MRFNIQLNVIDHFGNEFIPVALFGLSFLYGLFLLFQVEQSVRFVCMSGLSELLN